MKQHTTTSESDITTCIFGALARHIESAALLPALLLLLAIQSSHAGSATWNANPTSGDWETSLNWTPATVPNANDDGIDAVATFGASSITNVSLSNYTTLSGIVFNSDASACTIMVTPPYYFYFDGVGITNNSSATQTFVVPDGTASGDRAFIFFINSATAGSLTEFINQAGTPQYVGSTWFLNTSSADNGTFTNEAAGGTTTYGGYTLFHDSSTADNATFTNNGSSLGTGNGGGVTSFQDSPSAGNGIFTNNASTAPNADPGVTQFLNTSTGANGIFTNIGAAVSGAYGGFTSFRDTATAENATLIATAGHSGGRGGTIYFWDDSAGGTSRVEVFGNGSIDLSSHNAPGITIGSLEGSGLVFLGANKLTVGSNNLSATFSGVISGSGTLTKTGKGKLILSKASTYTGRTTVTAGTLLVTNKTGSATGTGAVKVSAGTLGGTGKITGAVTVASGTKAAFLAPGSGRKPGTLTILSALTFDSPATYKVDLNSTTIAADTVAALGITINSGAQISISDIGSSVATLGTIFTLVRNTSATPIAGTFSNLADGSMLLLGSNNYQVSYEGGTGNNLTLTVVP